MSWGGHKNHRAARGDEAIGSFKRQRVDAADGSRYQLPASVELYIYAWGAEFKYGGKGGSALACFFGICITFTIVDLESHCWNHIHRERASLHASGVEAHLPGGNSPAT